MGMCIQLTHACARFVAEQGAGCLMNLASSNADNQRAIQKAGALPPLLALLKDKAGASRRAREYVAGALMNLTLKQPSVQAEVAKGGAIPLLVEMLAEKEGQMEEVAGALTNLADTNEDNQAEICKAGARAATHDAQVPVHTRCSVHH